MSIPSPDIIVNSYTPEGTPAPATLSPEQQAARTRGRELRATYEKTKETDPLAGLKRPEKTTGLSQIDVASEVNRRIGIPEITEITDEQIKLRETTFTAGEEAKIIAERGLEGIADIARQEAIVEGLVKTVLDIRPQFASLSDEEKRAIIRDLLQNPKNAEVRTVITGSLAELLDPDTDTAESITPIKAAHETHETARKAVKSVKKEIKSTSDEIDVLKKTANEHAATNPDTGAPGVKFQEIETLRGSIDYARMTSLRDSLQRTYGENFERAQQLVREKIKNGSPLAAYDKELGELVQMTDKAKRLEELIGERDGLPDKLTQKQKHLEKLRKQKVKRKIERDDAEETFDETEETKNKQEQTFARSVENVLSDSLNSFLDQDIEARNNHLRQISEEKIRQAGDGDEKRVLAGINSRWEETE